MDKFFIPNTALEDAQRAIVSKIHTSPMLDITDVLRLGLGYYEKKVLYSNDEMQQNFSTGRWFICHDIRSIPRQVRTALWYLLPFLREQASYAGLYISEHTDWSQWFADYDCYRMGVWLYMPEMPEARLEAIEIFESFGEFPT
jgi:hypothetical protein